MEDFHNDSLSCPICGATVRDQVSKLMCVGMPCCTCYHPYHPFDMTRNLSANEDILYKCTIDEVRLRVISDLQENYKKCMNIHELLCIGVY